MSRARKRSRLEIVMEVLEALGERSEVHATELSLLVKLSYDRLRGILDELAKKGILTLNQDTNGHRSLTIKLTSEGWRLLNELSKLKKLLEDYGLI